MRIKNIVPILVAAQAGVLLTGCSPKVTNAEELLAEYNKKERDNYSIDYYADTVRQETKETGTSALHVQTVQVQTYNNGGNNHSVVTINDDGTVTDTYELYSVKNEEDTEGTSAPTEEGDIIEPGAFASYKMFEEVSGTWEKYGNNAVPGVLDITSLPEEELKEASFVDSDGEYILTIDGTYLMETDFGRELVEGIEPVYEDMAVISTISPGTVTITFDKKTLNITGITVSGMHKTIDEGTSEEAISPDTLELNIYYTFDDYGEIEEEIVMPE